MKEPKLNYLGAIGLFLTIFIIITPVLLKEDYVSNTLLEHDLTNYCTFKNRTNTTSIQILVDESNDGDTIEIENGFYQGTIYVNKSVTIRGKDVNETIVQTALGESVFVINAEGCSIENISLVSSRNSTVSTGILINSNRNCIKNCIVSSFKFGLFLNGTEGNVISSCISTNNRVAGIYLDNSRNNIISKSFLNSNSIGIFLTEESNNNSLIKIESTNNVKDGIYIDDSSNNLISYGNFSNNKYGINIYESDFVAKGTYCKGNHIEGSTCVKNLQSGITIYGGINNIISKSISMNNGRNGIEIFESDNNIISNSTFQFNNLSGISNFGSKNRICNNTSNDNYYGLRNYDGEKNTIENNIFSNNQYGLYLSLLSTSELKGNICSYNTNIGIYLESSIMNKITLNRVEYNGKNIVLETRSSNNTLFQNNFYSTHDENYVFDGGKNNKWNNSIYGNYWSNWNNPDYNEDGIVDHPYQIIGSANSTDYFPLSFLEINDADNDGFPDGLEKLYGTNEMDPSSSPKDIDNDKIPDKIDTDRDGDGIENENDYYPDDPDKWEKPKENWTVHIIVIICILILTIAIIVSIKLRRKKKRTDNH